MSYRAGSHLLSVLYIVVCIFRSQSLNHPISPSLLGVHLFVLYISSCFTNRFICAIFIIPHICVNTCTIFVFLFLTYSLCMTVFNPAAAAAKSLQLCPTLCDPIDGSPSGSAVPGVSRQEYWSGLPFPSPSLTLCLYKWHSSVPFNCWVIFHCVCVPHLYTFLCWWRFKLLSCPGYCCPWHWIISFQEYLKDTL